MITNVFIFLDDCRLPAAPYVFDLFIELLNRRTHGATVQQPLHHLAPFLINEAAAAYVVTLNASRLLWLECSSPGFNALKHSWKSYRTSMNSALASPCVKGTIALLYGSMRKSRFAVLGKSVCPTDPANLSSMTRACVSVCVDVCACLFVCVC